MQITHDGTEQIVSPATLQAILRQNGDSMRRPAEFRPGDEWNTGTQACPYCHRKTRRSSHEVGCPVDCGRGY